MVSQEISNHMNYEIEIAKLLKAKMKILHYKEINEIIFSKYETIRNADSYLKKSKECVKVAPGFYAHRDMTTNEFYNHLDFEKKQINKFIRKEIIRKNEVTIYDLSTMLFDQQISNLFSKKGIKFFISNAANLDEDLKRLCFPSSKKFMLKQKSDEYEHKKEKIDTEAVNFTKTFRSKDNQKECGLHLKKDSLKDKSLKKIIETELSDLNLSVRSSNCILNTLNLSKVRELILYTEDELLRVNNFGITSLREIKEVLSSLGLRLGMKSEEIEYFETHHRATPTKLLSVDKNNIYSPLERKISAFNLSVRSRSCLQAANVTKVKDLVQYTVNDLFNLKNFGRKSLTEIQDFLRSMGLHLGMTSVEVESFENQYEFAPSKFLFDANKKSDANRVFQAIPWMIPVVAKFIANIMVDKRATVAGALKIKLPKGSETRISEALTSIGFRFFGSVYDEVIESLPERLQIIATKRIHSKPPLSLVELGKNFDLTRERVRQIELKVRDLFKHRFCEMDVTIQSRVLRALLGKVLPYKAARQLSGVLVNPSQFAEQAFIALLQLAGPYYVNFDWIVRVDAQERINSLKSKLVNHADRIGRIDSLLVGRETAGLFRNEEERDRFLIECLKLHKLYDEWVVTDSQRRRVFLSLYKIGRPATNKEIASLAGIDNPVRVGSYLTGVNFVCRADKERWAFVEWVDNPYDGIVGEIKQRIYEDGGKTTFERIIRELPNKFGVSENSVRTYLATPQFVIENGYVRCATQEEISNTYFGDVEDVVTAVCLEDGAWAARIHIEERFFDGYSAAIPAPVAWECGFKPGDSVLVPVEGTEHIVSLIWRVNNPLRTIDFGRIAPVLREFELEPGDEIVVAPSSTSVRIFRAEEAPIAERVEQLNEVDPVPVESLLKVLFTR